MGLDPIRGLVAPGQTSDFARQFRVLKDAKVASFQLGVPLDLTPNRFGFKTSSIKSRVDTVKFVAGGKWMAPQRFRMVWQ